MNVRVGENDASVLVVEDDASIARALRRTLGRAGYRVSVTPTLTAARGKLSAALDAAIVDVHVWDGAGEDVAREIFQRRLPCGLVLSSVAGHDRAKTVARRWRADGMVLKPYTKPEVLEAVDLAARVGRCRKKNLHRPARPRAR